MGILSILNNYKIKVAITTVLISVLIFRNAKCLAEESDDAVGGLPFCDENIVESRDSSRKLLFVTTLDGKLTALDLTKQGNKKWSVDTGPGGLLSSSIHRLELTNNGNLVRLIPSLSGGLYKFDGDSLEVIPITADELLKSSFKFSDDLVISGGKETRSYGVSSRTGQVMYECSMTGCKNFTDSQSSSESEFVEEASQEKYDEFNPMLDDMIVVRRQTQTVRAIEPRSGSERWNFSIGHHEIEILKSQGCHPDHKKDELFDEMILNLDLRVIVPDGVICAFNKKDGSLLWKHQFGHPIVSVWKTNKDKDEIEPIDLFNGAEWLWNEHKDFYLKTTSTKAGENLAPSLYLGMFQKQLYVQESNSLRKFVENQLRIPQNLITDETNYPRIPWKPFPASSKALALQSSEYYVDDNKKKEEEETFDLVKFDDSSTSLSVLYATEYVNGNGFYLYSSEDFDNRSKSMYCDKTSKLTNFNGPALFQNETFKFLISGLGRWWKEVLVVLLTTAFVLNLTFGNRVSGEREVVFVERHIEVPVPMAEDAMEYEERRQEVEKLHAEKVRSLSESAKPATLPEYTSRFLTDFELLRRLGKGGFGVVFEAKNKLDDCNYAIKRIVLPKKQESRDRVFREVKTLATCEYKHIVRYFQAWVETPPPGWQEDKDKELFSKDFMSTSITIESPSPTETESKPFPRVVRGGLKGGAKDKDDLYKNILKKNVKNGHNDFVTNLNHLDPTFESSLDDASDSFIQFEAGHQTEDAESSRLTEADDDEEEDEEESDDGIVFQHQDASHVDTNHDDSFQIEFQHSTHEDLAISIEKETEEKEFEKSTSPEELKKKIKKHKRTLSLDLNTCSDSKRSISQNVANAKLRMYLYIQMQLCQKESLRDWLRNNDLSARGKKSLEIFDQTVCAVHYVHTKGLIHRDLKPSNIFFALDGQVKIGDFGLVTDMADITDESGSSSSTLYNSSSNGDFAAQKHHTQQVGTHLYMSPEQKKGLSYNYKVDIYSLGLILFELLVFFTTETERVIVLTNIKNDRYPKDFQDSFVEEFELLKMMLDQNPDSRPNTIGIMARPPLNRHSATLLRPEYHFELPPRDCESIAVLNKEFNM